MVEQDRSLQLADSLFVSFKVSFEFHISIRLEIKCKGSIQFQFFLLLFLGGNQKNLVVLYNSYSMTSGSIEFVIPLNNIKGGQ